MEGTKMGTYDFTYNVPANFNRRVVQFLQQFGKAHVAQAFQRCEYEYGAERTNKKISNRA